ncbi:16S rRNA (guanine(966)-N(2))-methyltransferase RsmD, partial [Butyribacter sp.]|uniref:16S rRNA (guanine(966)-N(2))-methyltransferase RsmD n=1 Tax=Butyribacter sp. TaxID=2822465 RepID=UPI002A993E8F|nr:16S rRNA (guanine(966)-N(2))-methyltransferase RsmD [Butyribacter sp.]
MRVIAGKARRTNLVTPEGKHTRPTSDRIKETLFNILQNELYDISFLDIFSGSGGIAIEALSRGAKEAVLIDNDTEAVRCIKENIKRTHFEDMTTILKMDAISALKKLEITEKKFDIIFMDPPYNHEIEAKVLDYLLASKLVHK